jgi:hypothetical protein
MRQSLLNTPTPPYPGPGAALYGERGPAPPAPDYRGRRKGEPPQSLNEHIDDAVAKVPDLSPKQRNAVKAAMLTLTRDITFIRMIADQGRHHVLPMDEGRAL